MMDSDGVSLDKDVLAMRSAALQLCPFCKGKAEFYVSKNIMAPLHVRHIPGSGVNCPVRWDQHCESYEQGSAWWNRRAG